MAALPSSSLLVVDDDPGQLRTLTDVFAAEGFDVVGCSTAAEAFEHLHRSDVAVAVVDLRLPDLSDRELLHRLDAFSGRVEIIIYTAYSSYESAREAVNVGAFAYVEKGRDLEELVRHVRRAFATRVERDASRLLDSVEQRMRELREANERLKQEVAARQHTEQRLRQRDAELQHVARLSTLGEMAAGVTHEINQPLFAISNYLEAAMRLLQSSPSDREAIMEVMERITASVDRAVEVARRVRDFVRRRTPVDAPVDMNGLMREALSLLDHDIQSRGVAVHLELADDVPEVRGDAVAIEQVVVNLVRNALDALAEANVLDPRITVAVRRFDEQTVEVAVADNGRGPADGIGNEIFDAFVTTKSNGLGMGLAISRSIVEAHGGRIWAEPNSPQGTIFRFTLPLTQQSFSQPED